MPFRISVCLAFIAASIASACTYCDPSNLKIQSYRQEARTSKLVVIGYLNNARLVGDMGFTDLVIEQVVKDDGVLEKRKTVTLPRWTLVDPKKPPRMMVFCDQYEGKLDPFRGVSLRGDKMADYLAGALKLKDTDRIASLLYYFKHLDSPDPEVAADAFLEFAKATDQEVGAVGSKLDAGKLRKLMDDPKTPVDRIGLFAFLLGACGTKSDADLLASMLDKSDERMAPAVSGILGGLIEIRPEAGWKRAIEMLQDPKRPYQDKLSILGTLRFFQAYKPDTYRKPILAGMAAVVARGDMADMAIEDLRRWKQWDLTKLILDQYGKSTHAAPLVRNSIVRYALCAPDADAAAFIKKVRAADAESVADIERSLEFEKPTPPKKP
jgi:hypothetical protein